MITNIICKKHKMSYLAECYVLSESASIIIHFLCIEKLKLSTLLKNEPLVFLERK